MAATQQIPDQIQMPALGQQGEPCSRCGAPLAADQRYCLECGTRRGAPRVPLNGYAHAANGSNGAAPPAAATTSQAREPSPWGAVLGIAALGVVLLIGVLIGRGNNDNTTSAPPAITVAGAPTGSAAGDTANTAASGQSAQNGSAQNASNTGSSGSGGSNSGSGSSGSTPGATQSNGNLTNGSLANSDAPVQASDEDLQALNSSSGDSYEEAQKNLPPVIATSGEPAQQDNKPPGGASADDAQTFK
jgi:hypothetical protein